MIEFRANFFSEALGISTSATILLPQGASGQIGMASHAPGEVPLLYLLHGYSDDDTCWLRRTSIERYASERGLAVVMPGVGTSFYCDEVHGRRYWEFVSEELPAIMCDHFRTSTAPEHTHVAGLSMGGYGAFKLALNHPDRFATAGSLSGALDMVLSRADSHNGLDLHAVWGDRPIESTSDDLVHLVRNADPTRLPRLWLTCGEQDFLRSQNESFIAAAREARIPLDVDWAPGDHEWGYWDAKIQQYLDFALGEVPR